MFKQTRGMHIITLFNFNHKIYFVVSKRARYKILKLWAFLFSATMLIIYFALFNWRLISWRSRIYWQIICGYYGILYRGHQTKYTQLIHRIKCFISWDIPFLFVRYNVNENVISDKRITENPMFMLHWREIYRWIFVNICLYILCGQ